MELARTATAGRGALLALAFVAFVSLGLPDTLFGVAWPGLRRSLGVTESVVMLLFAAAGTGYLVSSFQTGRLLRTLGVGPLLAASCAALAACCAGYALAPAFPWLVPLSLLAGLGSGAIDSGLNAYVSTHFTARHVNWLHAAYSLGATIGPLVMTAAIVRAGSWRAGYGTVAGIMLALTALFVVTARRWGGGTGDAGPAGSATAALRLPLVRKQALVFFVYTGLELTAGVWCFTVLTEARGLAAGPAGVAASVYFGAIGAGRVGFGAIADRIDLDRLLRGCTLAALAGALLFAAGGRATSVLGLAVLGLALAPIYPCLMARTPGRLGPDVAVHAFGLQACAAMLGAITVPGLAGVAAQHAGVTALALAVAAAALALLLAHERLLLASPARPADNSP